jgi:hypothetical protein
MYYCRVVYVGVGKKKQNKLQITVYEKSMKEIPLERPEMEL